ncbi:quaternary ammonium compound efflux SMR transporter SugE [Niveispirillum irakense]|uniref:quaternary ammonium compound efflux SMR transporter SugE n=1 Tax=Niveispirillum irakense TaxID=34011 RepID=UPI000418C3C8|nr:quaternary ammonium compound efflux SMR transporter SugE [Niveispirillum irakense]
MAWLYLFLAGLLEIVWALGLKYTEGFTRPLPTAITVVAMLGSIGLLGMALKSLPLGTAYAIWTGIGTVGTVIAGILFLGETASALRLACVALIVAGIVGLKLLHGGAGGG